MAAKLELVSFINKETFYMDFIREIIVEFIILSEK